MTQPRNNLPPAVVLPETLIHYSGRVIPGQFAGLLGAHHNPMFLELCRYNPKSYGAMPGYAFHFEKGAMKADDFVFQAPNLSLPAGLDSARFNERLDLLKSIGRQQERLERVAENEPFDRYRQKAISLLADRETQKAFNVADADPKTLDRYGRNTFGWSLLIARQLVEAGVNMVQVNLGNNETWDTHGNQSMFPTLKDFLFPPTDQALSALLDDLSDRGLLDSDADRDGRRDGPHAQDFHLPQHYAASRPRPLGHADRVLRRRRRARRNGRRLDRQDRRLPGGQPAEARQHGRHDLPGPGHPARAGLARLGQPPALRLQRRPIPGLT